MENLQKSSFLKLKKSLTTFPTSSGIYLMKEPSSKVIYIGKAANLKKRLASYFRADQADPKTRILMRSVEQIDFITTPSEREALLLEATLIKEYEPKYNISLKDDKSFPYIHITDEEFPAIYIERKFKNEVKKRGEYLGPYTSASLLREAFKAIRKIFSFRTCRIMPGGKNCLFGRIQLCPEPCLNKISWRRYLNTIKKIKLFLAGKYTDLLTKLQSEMSKASGARDFEHAAELRDQIEALSNVIYGNKIDVSEPLKQLRDLLRLKKIPERIEAFDISNIGPAASVGSMVSFFKGVPDKNNYRRFKIKTVTGINDFEMLAEIVRRRYSRLFAEKKPLPDLIIIDGGKGQLSAAKKELDRLRIKIPLMGIAKKEEHIFIPFRPQPIILAKTSKILHLIQKIRDEAHRFAISYHRLRRKKETFS